MGINLTDEQLRSVADLSARLVKAQRTVDAMEEQLKADKERLRLIEQQELPDLLSELGLEALTLKDGTSIAVKPLYGAFIAKDREDEAFKWLRDNGFGDLIKERVIVGVHPQTLKAWVKERVESGDEVPDKLFGIFVGRKAYVK